MKYGTDTIGLTITGNSVELKLFFSKFCLEENNTNRKLPALQYEVVEGHPFYYFIAKEIKWDAEHQLECNALCRAADIAKLSYYFCQFNSRTCETVTMSNEHQPFFDYHVRKLFSVRKTIQFEDRCYQTFKDWIQAKFSRTELADLCNYGAQAGWSGLIYYSETTALYEQYHTDIWELLREDCDGQGHKSIPELIASFGGAGVQTDEQFKNLLVWYAAEKIAFEITQGEYSDDDDDDEDDDISDDTDEA